MVDIIDPFMLVARDPERFLQVVLERLELPVEVVAVLEHFLGLAQREARARRAHNVLGDELVYRCPR